MTVRFDFHPFFAEAQGALLVLDGLADIPGASGAVFGVPVSLTLLRPASRLGEQLLMTFTADVTGKRSCHIELHLTDDDRTTMMLLPPGCEVTIPVKAASGLPLAL